MRTYGWAVAAVFALASCGKRDAGASKGDAAAPGPGVETWRVTQGVAPFLMRGTLRTLRGSLSVVRGELQIDFSDLTKTRGSIAMDLISLKMTSYEDASKNREQTRDAQHWLGLIEDADRIRWATFVIRGITSADPKDLVSGTGAQRRTRVNATGDLTLHGHTAPCEVKLEATVAFEGTRGRAMHLRTVDDFAVKLAPYDVKPPPEGHGKALADVDRLIVDGLAGTADVAIDLAVEPVSL